MTRRSAVPGSWRPGTDATDALDLHPDAIAGRRVFHRREPRPRSNVGGGLLLQQRRRPTRFDRRPPMDDQILRQSHRSPGLGLKRERDPRIAPQVLDLLPLAERGNDQFVTIDRDPGSSASGPDLIGTVHDELSWNETVLGSEHDPGIAVQLTPSLGRRGRRGNDGRLAHSHLNRLIDVEGLGRHNAIADGLPHPLIPLFVDRRARGTSLVT